MNQTIRFWLTILFFFALVWVFNRTFTQVKNDPNREGQVVNRGIIY